MRSATQAATLALHCSFMTGHKRLHFAGLFLDISKANDRVRSDVLLRKIHEQFNIHDHILAWILSWLKQRSLQVWFNGSVTGAVIKRNVLDRSNLENLSFVSC